MGEKPWRARGKEGTGQGGGGRGKTACGLSLPVRQSETSAVHRKTHLFNFTYTRNLE